MKNTPVVIAVAFVASTFVSPVMAAPDLVRFEGA